jgi:cysteine desulfurase/selenocysteine lyase
MAMTSSSTLDVATIKRDFPLLMHATPHGRPVVYLDSASSSQKPQAVLDAMEGLYETTYANVHRGVYQLGAETTERYEGARATVARFIGAGSEREIVFTKNVTEAINLVAYTWGRQNLHDGDVVVLTHLEHHANIVPWLMLQQERDIEIRWIPLNEDFTLDLSDLDRLVHGAKLVAVSAMSNVLGTLAPVRVISDAAHAAGALCLVDAAQRVPHLATNVADLGCDFLGFTGHKMLGPTGVGVLWARPELLDSMPPFLGGGEMIRDVRLDGFTTNEVPWKFEAGTPPIAEAVGLGRAVEYLESIGIDDIRTHEKQLTAYALRELGDRFGDRLTIHGPTDVEQRGGVLSLALQDVHPHDVSQVLDQHGVCVRAGHHCAKPLMRLLGVNATARASFYLYNDEADVDALADALSEAAEFFLA